MAEVTQEILDNGIALKLEIERTGEASQELEREVSTGHKETWWRTPDTSILDEPENKQPRAALQGT